MASSGTFFFPSATPSNDSEIGPVISGVCIIDQAFQSLKILAIGAARENVTCLNSQFTTKHDIHETANPCTFAELSVPLHLMDASCTTFAGRVEPGRRHVEGDFHKEGQREGTDNNQNCSGGWTYSGKSIYLSICQLISVHKATIYLSQIQKLCSNSNKLHHFPTELQLWRRGRKEDFQKGLEQTEQQNINVSRQMTGLHAMLSQSVLPLKWDHSNVILNESMKQLSIHIIVIFAVIKSFCTWFDLCACVCHRLLTKKKYINTNIHKWLMK